MSSREAASWLKVSLPVLYRLAESGKIAHYRLGVGRGTYRFDLADLEAYLASCRVQGPPPSPALPRVSYRPRVPDFFDLEMPGR